MACVQPLRKVGQKEGWITELLENIRYLYEMQFTLLMV